MNKETGYPHIDKPWMKYYDEKIANIEDPKTNITEYLKMKTKGNESLLAHSYYGKNMTLDELFDKASTASKVLTSLGVKKGEIVMNMLPNIPESAQIWLGCANIGAVADFIDPRPDSMDIMANAQKVLEVIKYERAKYIVALDKCYLAMLKPIEKELKELGIENIVIISASDSMNLSGKIDYLKDALKYNELKNIRNNNLSVKKLKSYEVLYDRMSNMQKEEKLLKEAIASSILKVSRYSDLIRECRYTSYITDTDAETITYIGHTSDAVTRGILYGDIIVPRYEMDGRSYIRTRDLVQMDKNGVFYHEARKDRSFTRFDGYKIKPYEIESIIEKNDKVKYAKLVEYFDDRQRGIMPMCHLVLKNNDISEEEKIEVIKDIVYNNIIGDSTMSSRQIPAKFKIRESMPLTKNSKVDFNALKNEPLDGSEINVDVSETNLTVDHIEIYKDTKKSKTRIKNK